MESAAAADHNVSSGSDEMFEDDGQVRVEDVNQVLEAIRNGDDEDYFYVPANLVI